jgi:hypothetical protein
MESWVAGKPTVELIFERDPLWYREEHARCNVECDEPSKLVATIEREISGSGQSELRERRQKHLEKWCSSPNGQSSLRLAQVAARAVREKPQADWSKLDANDRRRALKLAAYRKLGLAYHFDPLLYLKSALFGKRYAMKEYAYRKSILPGDVEAARQKFEQLSNGIRDFPSGR